MSLTDTKACTSCGAVKPITDFYPRRDTKSGLNSRCKTCFNASLLTSEKVIRNRARHRATTELIRRHKAEFDALFTAHRIDAQKEAELLAESASASQHFDGEPVRLRPGARMPGQDALDRIDVARCRRCHSHHDSGHVCQNCGHDERASDALANEYDDDDLRADFRRDVSEAIWA